MKLQPVEGMGEVVRYCCSCRRQARAAQLVCDMQDADRWTAWYCTACVARGYATAEAKRRKKKAANSFLCHTSTTPR